MATIEVPLINAVVQDVTARDGGFLLSPPIAWQTDAAQIAAESGSYFDGNRIPEKGEIHGSMQPKLQDTYITGTGSRTGMAFTVVTGTVKDDWVNTRNSKYGLLFPDATNGATAPDVVQTTPDGRIYSSDFVIRRGAAPVSLVPTSSTLNAYLHLQYGNAYDYRIALESGKPLRLDYYNGLWRSGVSVSQVVTDIEAYLAMNSGQVTLRVLVDYNDNTLVVKVGNFTALKHSPSEGLSSYGHIRYTVKNGDSSLQVFPLRFQPLTVTKSARNFNRVLPVASAHLQVNGRAETDATQTMTAALTGDAQSVGYSLTASLPDAGDALGSVDMPKIADATLAMAGVWVQPLPGTIFLPPVMSVDILEVLDDASRTATSSALVTVNNWNNRYSGSYGHQAIDIQIATGLDAQWPAFSGIAGVGPRGIDLYRSDPRREMMLPCAGNEFKMQVPIGEEICTDGYAYSGHVRLNAELGNVHPQFMQNIELYVPPGGNAAAPFGPAGDDYNGYSLSRGSGLNAKHKYLPETTGWENNQRLAQEMGFTDPVSGDILPFYTGYTLIDRQYRFEPYNPRYIQPSIVYSFNDLTGYANIEEIHVYNSVYQMRTSIDFQGIDAFTAELLYYHLSMPDAVMRAVGFRYPWLERDPKFGSEDYMIRIADVAARLASIPTQVVVIKTNYHPWVRAGMTCIVADSATLGGAFLFYITEIRSRVGGGEGGNPHQDCYSYVTARRVENF